MKKLKQGVALRDSFSCSSEEKPTALSKVKNLGIKLWQDESGQGTAEYVLILVGVVALALLFKDKIVTIVKSKMGDVGDKIADFNP